jgi:hypothetical protein
MFLGQRCLARRAMATPLLIASLFAVPQVSAQVTGNLFSYGTSGTCPVTAPCTIAPGSGNVSAYLGVDVTPGAPNQYLALTTSGTIGTNQALTVFNTNGNDYAFTLLGKLVPPGGG